MKLSQLYQQDKIKLAAELDGWTVGNEGYGWPSKSIGDFHPLPQYDKSYDAVIPLIQKQPKEVREKIAEALWGMLGIDSDWSEQEAWAKNMLTTPSQLLDALIVGTDGLKKGQP